ncbi:MAG: hypothetical protein ABFD89_00750 [Bryobacteraceae bacterium]
MGLAVSDKDIEQMRQGLFSWADRLKEVVQELRDESTVKIHIDITFEKKGKSQ